MISISFHQTRTEDRGIGDILILVLVFVDFRGDGIEEEEAEKMVFGCGLEMEMI